MKRLDIRGRVLEGSTLTTKCYECGMPLLDAAEYHPHAACVVFERTHDSREVWNESGEFVASADE